MRQFPPDDLINAAEAAALLGIGEGALSSWLRRGILPLRVFRTGKRMTRHFSRLEVAHWYAFACERKAVWAKKHPAQAERLKNRDKDNSNE